jgi:hypothetical protein
MDKRILIISGVIAIVLIAMFGKEVSLSNRLNRLEATVDSIAVTRVTDTTPIVVPDDFNYVMERFSLYNNAMDTNTVLKFIEVTTYLGLNDDDEVLTMLVGQICLESAAKQFYSADHIKAGKVVRGLAGEVGMTQIMPKTAIGYLRNHVSDDTELYNLGATNFNFVHGDGNHRGEIIKWLSNTDNNLILWGFIMRDNLESNGIIKGLVEYNAGYHGMRRFTKNNDPENHSYIKHIKDTLNDIEEMLAVAA